MACMEHECWDCGHAVMNNDARSPSACEKCGGLMRHAFDEPLDDYDDDYERDEDDE